MILHSQGTSGSIQDWQSDGEGHSTRGQLKGQCPIDDRDAVASRELDARHLRSLTRATQAVFHSLGQHDLMCKTRASEIPPKFLRGAYKSAMRVALHECEVGEAVQSEAVKSRVWKLFVLLPGKFLFKLPCGGLVAKSKMVDRFKFFSDGRWEDLLLLSRDSAVAARSKTLRASQELEEREVPPAVLGHDC